MGRRDLALRGLNDHASTGSGPTHQSDARDSELFVSVDVARAGYCSDYPLLLFKLRPVVYRFRAARLNGSINPFSVTIVSDCDRRGVLDLAIKGPQPEAQAC